MSRVTVFTNRIEFLIVDSYDTVGTVPHLPTIQEAFMKSQSFFVAVAFSCLPLILAFAPHDDGSTAPDSSSFAAPVGIGQDGPFAAENIQVLGHLTLSEMGGGPSNIFANDCWGWTDSQTGNEYAICGLEHGTSFIDVSDPTDPKFLGFLPTQTGVATWRDMKVFDDHVFIVSDFNEDHGVQVFDLTELRTANPNSPSNFSNTAFYGGVGSAHNIAINEDTGFAYVVGSDQADGGLHIVDVNNPTSPSFAANFEVAGYTHDAQIVVYNGPDNDYAGREIAFCCNGRLQSDNDTLAIIDVTNKSNINLISNTGYPQPGYSHQGWLSEDQRYFYLGDETDENSFGGRTRILVWDCQDLDSPQFMGVVQGPTNAVDHNLYINGDKLYLANYSAGLRVFQIDENDPMNLTEIAFVDTFMTDNDADFDGAWSSYPFFESGTIIVNDRQNGMFAVRLSPVELTFPNGMPSEISPNGEVEFQVLVNSFGGDPQPGTGVLHVDLGNGFETFPMSEVSTNLYDAQFPVTECGSSVKFFVSAMSTNGLETCIPTDAPTTFFSATSADSIAKSFVDDFQTNQGWSVTGNVDDGQWERGVPQGNGQRGDPITDGDGSGQCFVTDNEEGNSDVDGGITTLTSPVMDAVGDGTAVSAFISYYRWYSNDVGNAPAADIFEVEISNNNGQTWVNLETVGPAGNEVSGGWFFESFLISDFVTPTDQMRIRFMASDLGDGSVVEAGVDGVEIALVQCDDDQILLGDVNQDGVINLLDVEPFVQLLANAGFQFEADINGDGVVNLLDVAAFIDLLAG